jgi:hypothetical protein
MSSHALTVSPKAAPLPAAMSFSDMMQMGDALVRTGFLPETIKNGAQAAAVILAGRELGMEPMRALRSITLVKGKVTESADSQLARFKSDGGRAVFKQLDDAAAVLWLRHPNGDEHTESFTMDDAKRAQLTNSAMYTKFGKAMLRSRAITAGLKSVGWEGGAGNYDPDELATVPAPMVRLDDVAPETLRSAGLTLAEAEDITLKGRRLGDMTDERLAALETWAAEVGNHRLLEAASIVLAARQDAVESAVLQDVRDEGTREV